MNGESGRSTRAKRKNKVSTGASPRRAVIYAMIALAICLIVGVTLALGGGGGY